MRVRYSPLGRNIVELLHQMNTPVTNCAADVIRELEEEIEYREREYDDEGFIENIGEKLRYSMEDLMDVFEGKFIKMQSREIALKDSQQQLAQEIDILLAEKAQLKQRVQELEGELASKLALECVV